MPPDAAVTTAEMIINQLAAWGVRRIYGVSGDSVFGLLDAIRKNPDLFFVQCRHEESAAFMASAQAKLTGQVGVCLADGGPGAVHLLNGLLDAMHDHVPVIALVGQVDRRWLGTSHIQAMDVPGLFGSATVYAASIVAPEQAAPVLETAFRTAHTRPGPVVLALPRDVQTLPAAGAVDPFPVVTGMAPRLEGPAVQRAGEVLAQAERPVILAGRSVRGLGEAVLELAATWGAGVVTTLPAKGAVPEDSAPVLGCLGLAGNRSAREIMTHADTVLILGSTWWPDGFVPGGARVVQVEHRPERLGSGKQLAAAVVGDVREVVPALTAELRRRAKASVDPGSADGGRRRPGWPDRVAAAVEQRDRWIAEATARDAFPLHPAGLIRDLEAVLAPDAVIALDTGDHTLWFGAHFRAARQDMLLSGMWRAMGYGLPAAAAAKAARPDRQVLCLIGDGGLAMVLAELATLAEQRLPVTVIVVNNGAFALEAHKQVRAGYPVFAQEFTNPDFASIMESVGGVGRKVSRAGQLRDLLREAVASDRPFLIDVPTARVPPPEERLPSPER